jgi:signal peptidase II
MKKTSILFFAPAVIFLLVLLDQLSKFMVRQSGGFSLCNPGVAWGISLPQWLFWFCWIAIIFFIILLIRKNFREKNPNKLFFCALLLLLSGALGNFLDRIFFGCVLDFIDLQIWPVFNLADVFITLGAILVIISGYRKAK